MQKTLRAPFTIQDIGLHSGKTVTMTVKPADANTGIRFIRTDLDGDNSIEARWDRVVDTQLCTVLANDAGATIGTVEHLMAALRGCDIDNAEIEVDAPEIPVMDGSSADFIERIDAVGIEMQDAPRRAIRVLKEVSVEKDGKVTRLSPSDQSVFGGKIVYDHPIIQTQGYKTTLLNGNFRHELSEARTFGLMRDVEAMRAAGLALGGSLDNAIVLDDTSVLNPDGLRFDNEFIRHKLLDAVGDLFLAGAPIIGEYYMERGGHALNNDILHALFADDANWEWVEDYAQPLTPFAAQVQGNADMAIAAA